MLAAAEVSALLAPAATALGLRWAVEPAGSDEHHAGRAAALLAAGGPVHGPRRAAPRWPAGLTGSISHGAGTAAAVAGRVTSVAAVGLDVEVAGALPAIDATAVCSAREVDAIRTAPDPDARATVVWSAKEAAFKAWDPWSGGALAGCDPRDIEVELSGTSVRCAAAGTLAALDLPPLRGCAVVGATAQVVVLVTADPPGWVGPQDPHG